MKLLAKRKKKDKDTQEKKSKSCINRTLLKTLQYTIFLLFQSLSITSLFISLSKSFKKYIYILALKFICSLFSAETISTSPTVIGINLT